MRVYYTGDMANLPGWFQAQGSGLGRRLVEEPGGEGRVIHVRMEEIGDVYHGHCNPRFVTEEAYLAFRATRAELTEIEQSVLDARGQG